MYKRQDVTFVVDLSDFGDADSAYGMFTSNVDGRQPTQKIGMNGQIVPRRAFFAKGRYFLEIAANPEGDHTAALRAWLKALDGIVTGSAALPEALAWFPAEGRQSLRLVPESVLGIRLLKRGYVAQYDFGKAFVAYETSPDSASAIMQKLRARFGQVAAANLADDAFQATDPVSYTHLDVYKRQPWIAFACVAASWFVVETKLGLMTTYFFARSAGPI